VLRYVFILFLFAAAEAQGRPWCSGVSCNAYKIDLVGNIFDLCHYFILAYCVSVQGYKTQAVRSLSTIHVEVMT